MKLPSTSPKQPASRPRVLLADDHVVVAEALCHLLEPSFEVLGYVTDGQRLLDQAAALDPDVVVVDASMPRLDGFEAIRILRRRHPKIRTVVLSIHSAAGWVEAAFDAGANAYVVKSACSKDLSKAIREAFAGRFWASEEVACWAPAAASRNSQPEPEMLSLSTREVQVALQVAEGLPNQEIATRLGIAEVTVRTHLSHIFDKLGVKNRVELAVRVALQRESLVLKE